MEDSRHAVSDKVLQQYKSITSGNATAEDSNTLERRPLQGDWYQISEFYLPPSSSGGIVLIDSPICFEDLAEASVDETVYCQAMCGNNIHKECFNQWARSKRQEGVQVTCGTPFLMILRCSYSLVYCRSVWGAGTRNNKGKDIDDDDVSGDEGYVNLGKLVGLSPVRGNPYLPVYSNSLTSGLNRCQYV